MKMYYRLEPELDYFLVKHVETDREVGYAFYTHSVHPDGSTCDWCEVYNNAHQKLDSIPSTVINFPLRCATITLAFRQRDDGFPDLQGAAWNDNADRVERRLGTLLADTAWAFSRAFCEATGQGVAAETSDKFGASLAELAAIWSASRVGSFNGGTREEVPYFANPARSGPRLTFSGAAQTYGMRELRARHPDLSDVARQMVLGWVLQWLSDALLTERDEQQKDRDRSRAWMVDQRKRYRSRQGTKVSKRTKVPRCSS